MDTGQNRYKKRTLTYDLEQPAQETNPLIYNKPLQKPTGIRLVGSLITISRNHTGS